MKRNSAGKHLPATVLCWGALALVLRMMLYRTGIDARNLLVRHHPLSIALGVLTIGVLIRILLAVRKPESSRELTPTGLPAALGSVAAGAGILATVLTAAPGMENYLENLYRILGLAAPVCLLLAGISQAFGKKPFFLLHVVVCLFFVLHIITHYQLWSSHPQIQDYVFSLLGAMALMFCSFYAASREAGCGNPGMTLGMGLAAIYLCAAELARSSCPALYLGGILWMLTNLHGIEKNDE